MKTHTHLSQPLTLASVVFLLGMLTSTGYGALDITLGAEKPQFRLGEPVVLLVSVTNRGAEAVTFSPELGPEGDFLIYAVTDPDGKETPFSPLFVADRADVVTLQRDETVRGAARIYYGGNGFTFAKPGTYRVVARQGDSRSQPLEVRVLAPANDAEREQASLILGHPEVGLFLMLEGGDELVDGMQQINTLIRKYPASPLTPYVQYALAKNLSVPARNFVSRKPRGADLPKAVEMLQEVKGKEMQTYYQARAVGALATSLTKLNRKEEAAKVLQEFQRTLDRKENLRPFFLKQIERDLNKLR
jgi:hypothetical protein